MEKNWESYDKPNYKRMMGEGQDCGCTTAFASSEGGCGCPTTKKAEEPVVQEPDWIPDGDGRAIGQQDFAINLSPLHAETLKAETIHEKGDYRIIAEEDYDVSTSGVFQEREDFDDLMELSDTHGMFTISLQKKVMGGWKTIDSVSGVVPHYGGMEEVALMELGIPNGLNFDAESRFDKLSKEIADEYKEKGMSPEKAQEVGDATAAKIGRAKYGKTGMRKMQKKGMKAEGKSKTISYDGAQEFADEIQTYVYSRNDDGEYPMDIEEFKEDVAGEIDNHSDNYYGRYADTVGNPSPMFNEDITGQDGPSSQPTNATFEAMNVFAPSSRDVDMARRDLKNSGYGDVVYDRYMVNRDGSSNKFYYTAVTEKDGKYYPMGSYGRIGYYSKLFNIMGKKESPRASTGSFEQAYRQCRAKEQAKIKRNYVDYTLKMAESETLSQIEGPTAEATDGGLHSPSSFAMTWENEVGTSSPSMPPNEIAWAEDVKGSESFVMGSIYAIGLAAIGLTALIKFGSKKKNDTASGDDTKNAEKGCGCAKTVKKSVSVKESEYSVNQINPVEVEGQNDIYNAESVKLPSPYMGPQTAHRQNNRPVRNLW